MKFRGFNTPLSPFLAETQQASDRVEVVPGWRSSTVISVQRGEEVVGGHDLEGVVSRQCRAFEEVKGVDAGAVTIVE